MTQEHTRQNAEFYLLEQTNSFWDFRVKSNISTPQRLFLVMSHRDAREMVFFCSVRRLRLSLVFTENCTHCCCCCYSKVFMSQLPACNTDEIFWQTCFAVIRLKKPPANVCPSDDSLEHFILEEHSGKLEGGVLNWHVIPSVNEGCREKGEVRATWMLYPHSCEHGNLA